MRARQVAVPSFDELYDIAPQEIKDYIDKCVDTPQSPEWHPEGNVNIHIRLVYDRAKASGDINLALAAFFHDLGKVDTTARNKKGGWSAYRHEYVSAKIAERHRDWITELGADVDEVIGVVKDHMRIKYMSDMKPPKQEDMRANPYFDKLKQFTPFDNMKTLSNDEKNRYK